MCERGKVRLDTHLSLCMEIELFIDRCMGKLAGKCEKKSTFFKTSYLGSVYGLFEASGWGENSKKYTTWCVFLGMIQM